VLANLDGGKGCRNDSAVVTALISSIILDGTLACQTKIRSGPLVSVIVGLLRTIVIPACGRKYDNYPYDLDRTI